MLAEAGLERLGLAGQITQVIPLALVLPAVGQGALGLEIRSEDALTAAAVTLLDDPVSHQAVVAERAMLAALHGGCLAPVAAWARFEQGNLMLIGRVLSSDGRTQIDAQRRAPPSAAAALGREVAKELLTQGAGPLIEAAQHAPGERLDPP